MYLYLAIASISPDTIKAILILVIAAVIIAGPLVYRILSGESFSWIKEHGLKGPDKNQWQDLRDRADQIIEASYETDANEIFELIHTMEIYKRKKGTVGYERDLERITGLYQKLQDEGLRIEPFDSLTEHLKEDGLTEQAQKLHIMLHTTTDASVSQIKKELRAELAKIKNQSWNILSPETRTVFEQSVKFLKHNPFTSIYVCAALIVFGMGLRFYHSIVEEKGYKFYKEKPIWIAVFAVIIGVPAIILLIKFLAWKYVTHKNPYQSNLTDNQ